MMVRAIYRAIAIADSQPPYDRASLKLFYPASYSGSDEQRNSGVIPVADSESPYPVVILMPGINVGPEAYSWLAHSLAESGLITVTYTLVAEEMPGYISLTPGLSIDALSPKNYGHAPSATAISPILDELQDMNHSGMLQGCLDLQRIILGGHSAGGSVAMLNARSDWFPGLCAMFSYGAHAGAAQALGYGEDAMFDLPPDLPMLILGGTRDGCISNSSQRYGDGEASATERVERTFDEAISRDQKDCYLGIIDGANHFSMAWPEDHSTGRPFIDLPVTRPEAELRKLLSDLICQFTRACAMNCGNARRELESTLLEQHPMIHRGDRR